MCLTSAWDLPVVLKALEITAFWSSYQTEQIYAQKETGKEIEVLN